MALLSTVLQEHTNVVSSEWVVRTGRGVFKTQQTLSLGETPLVLINELAMGMWSPCLGLLGAGGPLGLESSRHSVHSTWLTLHSCGSPLQLLVTREKLTPHNRLQERVEPQVTFQKLSSYYSAVNYILPVADIKST